MERKVLAVEMGKAVKCDPYSTWIIRDREGLEEIREPWNELASRQGGYEAFLCSEWFSLWTEHFLGERELFVLAVSEEGRIVCIAPCLRSRRRMYGMNARVIELMGNVYSPFRFLLLDRHDDDGSRRLLASILTFFRDERSCWDLVDFRSIPEERGWFGRLERAVQDADMAAYSYTDYGDWYLDHIDCSGEEYIAGLPKKIRKDVAYCRRRLEKSGDVEVKIIRKAACLDDWMDRYYRVYAKSWQKREGVGPTFHRDLARITAEKGWLRLGLLHYGGEPIAAQFWVTCRDTSFILKTVYDQEYRKFSPGKILTAEMMKYAIDVDGVREIDYGQGDEAYKRGWTPKRRERKGILVFNETTKGRYLSLIQNRIRPAVQRSDSLRKVVRRLRRRRGEKGSPVTEE